MKRASDEGIISVNTINPRDFTHDKHKKVDDTPYGGGAGMVLMPQPYIDAYNSLEKVENSITLMMTPQGKPFTDKISNELAKYEQVIIFAAIMKVLMKELEKLLNREKYLLEILY